MMSFKLVPTPASVFQMPPINAPIEAPTKKAAQAPSETPTKKPATVWITPKRPLVQSSSRPLSKLRTNLFSRYATSPGFEALDSYQPPHKPTTPSKTPPSTRTFSPTAATFLPASATTLSPATSPTTTPSSSPAKKRRRRKKYSADENESPRLHDGGKLQTLARYFFCQAYGLEGVKKRAHIEVLKDASALTSASHRAINEIMYGQSYSSILSDLRLQVPMFPANKVSNKTRAEQLQGILQRIQDGELADLTNFDGNVTREEATVNMDKLMQAISEEVDDEAGTKTSSNITFAPRPITRSISAGVFTARVR